jgi:hypothetical protein
MRLFVAAISIALLTVPAYPQAGNGIGASQGAGRAAAPPKDEKVVDPVQKAKDEKAFKDAVNRIPVPEKKYDPWGTVRASGASH